MERLTFDVYGQFLVHVERAGDRWRVLRVAADGKRGLLGIEVPPGLPVSELAGYLDDVLHEQAGPGDSVRLIGSSLGATEP